MGEVSSELIFVVSSLQLSARGTAALWLVIPVSAILIAIAWRIVRR
jgi:hypothetical protein